MSPYDAMIVLVFSGIVIVLNSMLHFEWKCRKCKMKYDGNLFDFMFTFCKHKKKQ